MRHHLWAAGLFALLVMASLAAYLISGARAAVTIFGSGVVPATISWGSMILVIDRADPFDPGRYDRLMLANFFVKILIVGAWTAIALLYFDWSPGIFATGLLTSFLAWHLLEAMMYQRHLSGRVQGDK